MRNHKRLKKILAILCIMTMITSHTTAFAQDLETSGKERMASISSFNATFTISNAGIASIDVRVISNIGTVKYVSYD